MESKAHPPPERQDEMQRGILHTHLCLQPCLMSLAGEQEHGPTGEHEELVPSLTLVMYSVPKDSLRELTVSPLPLSHLPSSLLTPGSCQSANQHPCDFTPLLPLSCGFPAPPCPALSTTMGCTTSPSTAVQSTPTLQLSGRQDLKDLVLDH